LGNFLIAEGTYKITARRTQTGEDKIAVVINLATCVQKAFFDELGAPSVRSDRAA
jgi:hypothetical protein